MLGLFPHHLEKLQSQMALMGGTGWMVNGARQGEHPSSLLCFLMEVIPSYSFLFLLIPAYSCLFLLIPVSCPWQQLQVPSLTCPSSDKLSLDSKPGFPCFYSQQDPTGGEALLEGEMFAHKFSLPFSGSVHPFQPATFLAYQPWGWFGKHFKQAGVSPARALPLQISSCCIPEKGHQILQELLLPLTVPEETSALCSHLRNLGLALIFC